MENEPVVLDTDTLSELSRGRFERISQPLGVDLRLLDWSRK